MELRSTDPWRPAATVFVHSSENKNSAAVRLMNMSGKSLDVAVDVSEGGSKQRTNIGIAKLNSKVPFDIYLPATGDGFADVAGRRVPIKVDVGPKATLSISCSSGHFRFDPTAAGAHFHALQDAAHRWSDCPAHA